MKKNIKIAIMLIIVSSGIFLGCKRENVNYNQFGNHQIKLDSFVMINDSIGKFKLIKNTFSKYVKVKIIRLDLNTEIYNTSFSQTNQDSIQNFDFNTREFTNIGDLFLEKKAKIVKIRIICNVLNYSNQLISDTIENQFIWKNKGQRAPFLFTKVPDYFYNFNDSSLSDFYAHASDLKVINNRYIFDFDRFEFDNSALKFNGNNNYLRYTDMQNLVFLKNEFTVSFWAKPLKVKTLLWDNYLIHPIQSNQQFGDGKSVGLALGQNQVNISSHTFGSHNCEITYDDNFTDWNQFTICVSGNKIALFVNGKFCKSSNIIGGNLYFSLAYCPKFINSGIGVAFDETYTSYYGMFDDFILYKSALTDSEILNLYNETK